ncbi:MAG: DUF2119 domain-containing protein [Methanobacteriales archaeon HGW-Methanobacteriales-1]|jgi:hypothetical protein|nr:MAG: DUF2119 domain-containing protein [Methanobacteriales archaeon HGW-Methanobacteriales-1]
MSFFKLIDKGPGLSRLFIGGVHGKEGISTIKALKRIQSSDVETGQLIIYNCDQSKYISTLDPHYYKSKMGKEILRLIKYYQPEMYIETHCYHHKNYEKLIDLRREEISGVPPLIELEKGVLMGSVSPHIRTSSFKREDICLTLEMPCMNNNNPYPVDTYQSSEQSLDIYLKILKVLAESNNRLELEKKISKCYPHQVKTARKYAREFFGEYPPF